MKVAITGANGYVGSRIAAYFQAHKAKVVKLTRNPTSRTEARFVLGEKIDAGALKGVDVLIHCAYDFSPRSWINIEQVNVEGTKKLFAAAQQAGVPRIIFISSMSAFDGCKSKYGKAKLAIEKSVPKNTIIVRPGLVYDEQSGGIVGAMRDAMKRSRIVPLVCGKQEMYPCHSADLAALIWEAASVKQAPKGPIIAAAEPLRFRAIVQELAASQQRKIIFVPVPATLVLLGLRAAELLHIPAGLRSDSLVGLMHANPRVSFAATKRMKTKFRPFTRALS